ncbi:hypothetical protein MKX03_037200, partial [Papaver bracteatum]
MDLSQGGENPSQEESEVINNYDVNGTPTSKEATVTKPKRKLTSDVWADFDQVEEADPENPGMTIKWAVCKLCDEKKKSCGNAGTSHLRRHANSCLKKRKIANSQTTLD